jgi:hypothetical protein
MGKKCAGERGADSARYSAHEVPIEQRGPILREYLSRYATTVQRYFTVKPTSTDEEFADIAHLHPTFVLKQLKKAGETS